MAGLRDWLRSSRSLVILFILVTILPAAALVVFGVRLLEQERALVAQRRREALERAVDQSIRMLDKELALWGKRLGRGAWGDTRADSAYVILHQGSMEVHPSGRLPYLVKAAALKEASETPFAEMESYEFSQHNLEMALEISRRLAGSQDMAVRAGALVREGRILRKLGRVDEALEAYRRLGGVQGVGLAGIPIDLVARRSRCAILEEQSRAGRAAKEASEIAADLRQGRWQLDRASYEHVTGQLSHWLGVPVRAQPEGEALAAAADWLYRRWTETNGQFEPAGVRSESFEGRPVLAVWTAEAKRLTAFLAGPQYVDRELLAAVRKALEPTRLYLIAGSTKLPGDAVRLQRTPTDTGLPWTVVVEDAGTPASDLMRWRMWQTGFVALLILVGAGTYLIWRAVNRELAVARLQSDFVSAVSHEFRTPLTSLRHLNYLLIDEDEPPVEKRRKYYRAQARATERLHHLVESLLDFGRMEAGRQPYRFEPLDAGALARDVAEEFSGEVEGRGFTVDCQLDSEENPVSSDPEALARALWNLLDNATKYCGDSRKIDVLVGRDEKTVSIGVRDYGPGVPAEEQRRIFDKFVRGEAAKSRRIRGTGLGLAMVSHIVKAHGGSVRVSSAPGEGSTFTMVLPVRQRSTR